MPEPIPRDPGATVTPILFDWPFGSGWIQKTKELVDLWNGAGQPPPTFEPPAMSSGVGVGIPYARYDTAGRRIAGEVVVVSNLANNAFGQPDTFGLPEINQTVGFMLKVINNTNRPIQAMFPYVFTYYGSPVYGEPNPMGPPIYPQEAAIYRVVRSEQGKMMWNYEGTTNKVLS